MSFVCPHVHPCYSHFYVVIIWTRIALYFLYNSTFVPGPDPSLCISVFCIITVIYAIFTFLHGPRRLPPFSHTIPGSLLLVF